MACAFQHVAILTVKSRIVNPNFHHQCADQGAPVTPPAVLPARAPPQAELEFGPADGPADQAVWPEIDQTGGQDGWD
jgi:hypothetical protein